MIESYCIKPTKKVIVVVSNSLLLWSPPKIAQLLLLLLFLLLDLGLWFFQLNLFIDLLQQGFRHGNRLHFSKRISHVGFLYNMKYFYNHTQIVNFIKILRKNLILITDKGEGVDSRGGYYVTVGSLLLYLPSSYDFIVLLYYSTICIHRCLFISIMLLDSFWFFLKIFVLTVFFKSFVY